MEDLKELLLLALGCSLLAHEGLGTLPLRTSAIVCYFKGV